jgi:hypothetical protein
MSGTRYLTEETLDQYLRYVTSRRKAGARCLLPADPCHVV